MRWRPSRPASISSWSTWRPMFWQALFSPRKHESARSFTRWPMATSRRSCPRWWTGPVLQDSRSPPAGKGTKYLPAYHTVMPDDVWSHYGLTPAEAKAAGMNAQMFNSFLDGTKSAIEGAAIANACGLDVPEDGLRFPPCSVDDLAHVLRPRAVGGQLDRDGMVEVVSSLERDGRPVFRDLRWGVYVVLKAPNAYAAACFRQYGLPTGATKEWRGDVASAAKRALKAGEMLDGEGGYTVYGKLMPAARSRAEGALPIGLAHRVKLRRDIPAGGVVRMSDVDLDESSLAVLTRRELERLGA